MVKVCEKRVRRKGGASDGASSSRVLLWTASSESHTKLIIFSGDTIGFACFRHGKLDMLNCSVVINLGFVAQLAPQASSGANLAPQQTTSPFSPQPSSD